MGVEPFLITATLEAVVAQRLVRTICDGCKERYEPDEDLIMELGPDAELVRGKPFWFGKGCARCHHTGYRGRTGIFEILHVGEEIRAAILRRASTGEIRAAAVRAGMRSLRDVGVQAMLAGKTTIEEVLRETAR